MSVIPRRSLVTRKAALRGAVAVELALLTIPLVLMTLALVEYSRAMWTYNQLVRLTREGARYLSGFDANNPNYASAMTIAKNRMLYGSNAAGSLPVVPGLTSSMIEFCDRSTSSLPAGCSGLSYSDVSLGATGSINLVRVQIRGFQFQPAYSGVSKLGAVTFDIISTTMRQGL